MDNVCNATALEAVVMAQSPCSVSLGGILWLPTGTCALPSAVHGGEAWPIIRRPSPPAPPSQPPSSPAVAPKPVDGDVPQTALE